MANKLTYRSIAFGVPTSLASSALIVQVVHCKVPKLTSAMPAVAAKCTPAILDASRLKRIATLPVVKVLAAETCPAIACIISGKYVWLNY